jgi:hypothetical protein
MEKVVAFRGYCCAVDANRRTRGPGLLSASSISRFRQLSARRSPTPFSPQSSVLILHSFDRLRIIHCINHDIRVLTEIFDLPEDNSDYRDVEEELDGVNPDEKRNPRTAPELLT